MEYLYSLSIAAAVSLAVIPVMASLAPRLGLVDHPDARKVHARPIPRVGGWGIVCGTVVAMLLWLPVEPLLITYLFGTVVLFVTGTWDDRSEIGHYPKFVAQLLAVVPLVVWADLQVAHLPFIEHSLPAALGVPFTVFALIGMINAVNHSDGLDGLAGGESLLSLGALGTIALLAGDSTVSIMAVAAAGAIAGFLRHNDYPASLFMGDAGSQFLGFTLGTLAVLITAQVDPALSPSVVLLILGLPIVDILVVLTKRIAGGHNWFRATRNHIHHRLLDLGMTQRGAVTLIYAIHASMVIAGIYLRYAEDSVIIGVYLGICVTLFLALNIAEHRHLELRRATRPAVRNGRSELARYWLIALPRQLLTVFVPGYLLVLVLAGPPPAPAYATAGLPLAALMLSECVLTGNSRAIVSRALLYAAATYIVYGSTLTGIPLWEPGAILLIALVVTIAVVFSPRRRQFEFQPTSIDLLVLIALGAGATMSIGPDGFQAAPILHLIVVLYAIELLSIERHGRSNPLKPLLFGVVLVMVFRGLS